MKKIMIMLGVVASAICVQAASVNWNLAQNSAAWKTGTMNVYAFANTTSTALATICSSTEASDWTDLGTSVGALSTTRGALAGTTEGFTKTDAVSTLAFVIVDGDVAEGSKYWVLNAVDVKTYVYEGTDIPTKFSFAIDANVASTGKFTAVPEPTSGLLMLLGMAGLALRRRRA